MSASDLLTKACKPKERQENYKKFDDMSTGCYKVKKFELKETEYGPKLQVFIENFFVYLPPRFTELINSQQLIDELNSKNYVMEYAGKDKMNFNFLQLKFTEMYVV